MPAMTTRRKLLRRIKLRHVLLILVLLSSVVPLVISSALLIPKAKEVLQDAERDYLTRRALALSREIDTYLATVRRQLTQLGTGLLLAPGAAAIAAPPHEPWVAAYLQSFAAGSPDLRALYVLDLQGEGPRRGPGQLPAEAEAAMNAVFEQARAARAPAYRLINMGPREAPNLALAVPVPAAGSAAGSAAIPRGRSPPPVVGGALLAV